MNAYETYANERIREFLNHYDSKCSIRVNVLKETLDSFYSHRSFYHNVCKDNISKLHNLKPSKLVVLTLPCDWGIATQKLTQHYGTTFAVLNMANPHHPGGGYLNGCVAQEENIFRRSDCHFYIDQYFDPISQMYTTDHSDLLLAKDNKVYLDVNNPRICIRGPENKNQNDLGYDWLEPQNIFPFYELRASAQNISYTNNFDVNEMTRRIQAQFNTLISNNIKYVIFGAFGCGVFGNPAIEVAKIYKQYIGKYESYFDVIAFAIFDAGYGPNNYSSFLKVLH